MLIQVILIAAVVVVTVMLTRSTANARHQAIRRLLLAGFVVAAVLAIIFPDALSVLAGWVGWSMFQRSAARASRRSSV